MKHLEFFKEVSSQNQDRMSISNLKLYDFIRKKMMNALLK